MQAKVAVHAHLGVWGSSMPWMEDHWSSRPADGGGTLAVVVVHPPTHPPTHQMSLLSSRATLLGLGLVLLSGVASHHVRSASSSSDDDSLPFDLALLLLLGPSPFLSSLCHLSHPSYSRPRPNAHDVALHHRAFFPRQACPSRSLAQSPPCQNSGPQRAFGSSMQSPGTSFWTGQALGGYATEPSR